MPNPRTKSKSPAAQRAVVTTDEAAQPEVDESDTAPAMPALSAVTAPLTHEQRRRLRHKLMQKYH